MHFQIFQAILHSLRAWKRSSFPVLQIWHIDCRKIFLLYRFSAVINKFSAALCTKNLIFSDKSSVHTLCQPWAPLAKLDGGSENLSSRAITNSHSSLCTAPFDLSAISTHLLEECSKVGFFLRFLHPPLQNSSQSNFHCIDDLNQRALKFWHLQTRMTQKVA